MNVVDKFILLLLRAKDAQPLPGGLWLQKEMFLLQNLFSDLHDETDFEPYFLGPYSETVADEAEELAKSELIQQDGQKIALTSKGKFLADAIAKDMPTTTNEKVEEFKDFLNDLSKDELLAFTYFGAASEVEYAKESIEYKSLLPKRKMLALQLLKKEKVSAQKAAQIAGISLDDFIKLVEQS